MNAPSLNAFERRLDKKWDTKPILCDHAKYQVLPGRDNTFQYILKMVR